MIRRARIRAPTLNRRVEGGLLFVDANTGSSTFQLD
jgi:hypothetical protein